MLSVAVLIHNRRLVPTAECNVTYARKLLIVLNGPMLRKSRDVGVLFWRCGQNPEGRGLWCGVKITGFPNFEACGAPALNNLSGTQYGDTKAQTKQETDRGSDCGTLDENHKRI
jgi:hypothetical protein